MLEEFSEAQDRAQEYLDARRDELSRTCSSISENVRHLQLKEKEARRQVEKIRKEARQREEEVARMRKEIETDLRAEKWHGRIKFALSKNVFMHQTEKFKFDMNY